MLRNLMIGAISAAGLTFSTGHSRSRGHAGGSAMLNKAVAAVKADQLVALATFLKGEGGFRPRSLSILFRIGDGKIIVSPKLFQLARTLEP